MIIPKTDLEQNKAVRPDEKYHGLGTRREKSCKRKRSIPDDFGLRLRSPVVQKPFQTKSATSVVARASIIQSGERIASAG